MSGKRLGRREKLAQKVGTGETLAQKVGRREIYSQKNDRKQAVCFAVCDLHDELNFPPNTARSKVDPG